MAGLAVASGKRLLVVATLPSSFGPTTKSSPRLGLQAALERYRAASRRVTRGLATSSTDIRS